MFTLYQALQYPSFKDVLNKYSTAVEGYTYIHIYIDICTQYILYIYYKLDKYCGSFHRGGAGRYTSRASH